MFRAVTLGSLWELVKEVYCAGTNSLIVSQALTSRCGQALTTDFVKISPFAQKPLWTDLHQIWNRNRGHRHNHVYQISWRSVKGCGFCGGAENCNLPSTKPVAVNTRLVLLGQLSLASLRGCLIEYQLRLG